MNISQIDQNIIHSIDRIRQIIIDLDDNIQDKYSEFYPKSDPNQQALQNLDADGFNGTDGKNLMATGIKSFDSFLKDIHNILDVYNLCTSSFAQQLDKIGIQQIQMFCKQLMLSHRKSMIFALRVVCSHYKVPQVVDERKFKIPTYEVEKEVIKEANAKKYNYKKVKIQRGTVDKDLVDLIKKHLIDKPELIPESMKAKLGQIYDPLLKEYREAEQVMNETLLNKDKFLKLQASNCGNFVSNTLKQIEGTATSFYNFEQMTIQSNKHREDLNSLTNEFYSNMIMEELSKEIKDNFEESTRKRMQSVIIQVIQFLRKQNQAQLPSVQCQTELNMEDINKQVQDAEKEARACRWELEAIKSNIRTLSLKNEELQREVDYKNKKISEQNQQIIDHISTIEKLKNEIIQLDIQYELKFKKKLQDLEQNNKKLESDLKNKFKEQENALLQAQKKTYAHSFTQTGKVFISNGENNHIYASQKHYTQFKRRYSHDLQLEGRVDYFYLLQKIKDDLEKHPMKRKKLNIPQDVNLRTENRAFTKMQKQLQMLQKIKEEEQEILNLRQQQQGFPQISSQQMIQIKNPSTATKKPKEIKELEVKGTSSQLLPQDQLECLLNQYQQTKSQLQSQESIQIQMESRQAIRSNSSKLKQTQAENSSPLKLEQQSLANQKVSNALNQEQQKATNNKEVYRYLEELKKSQGELFKKFSTDQINEIENFIISKEMGDNNSQNPQYDNEKAYLYDQNGNAQEHSAQDIQALFDEYNKLKPFQELVQQLQWIQSEGERAYVIGILNNYICKLLRRRTQIHKRKQTYEFNNQSLSPDSFSLSPEQNSAKRNLSQGKFKNDNIYNEESEKKDGFQSYKQFQNKLKNHQTSQSVQKNRQRSCYSFNSPSSVNVYYKNLNESSGNYEKFMKDYIQNEINQSPNKQKTPRDNQNEQSSDFNSTEKSQRNRIRRQYSLDRCETLNLPALNIIQKAQEHLQQFQQSVILQNCKKIQNRILIQKKLKLNDDISKSKSLKNIKSQISIAPINEEEIYNFTDYNDENFYQIYKQVTLSHELMLECVQIFSNSSKGQQSTFTNEQAKQLLKQSKYPFQSIQQNRTNGINNLDQTFTIWKNQFQQLPSQLKSYIIKKIKQVKK